MLDDLGIGIDVRALIGDDDLKVIEDGEEEGGVTQRSTGSRRATVDGVEMAISFFSF